MEQGNLSLINPVMHFSGRSVARWPFVDESHRLFKVLDIHPGDSVLEIGCGSGANFEAIQECIHGAGELTGVDSCELVLRKARERVQNKGWRNVLLIEHEYGREPIASGRSDVVLLSFWTSTASNWRAVLECAQAELRPGGRIGVVDFCGSPAKPSRESALRQLFVEKNIKHHNAWFGALPYFIFVGEREVLSQQEVA